MGRVTETIATVNSAVRTALVLAILGVIVVTGWIVNERIRGTDQELDAAREELASYRGKLVEAEDKIVNLEQDVTKKAEQISRLETAMRLLKMDKRLARIDVLEQKKNEETDKIETRLQFVELTPDGDPIGAPKEFTIAGDVVYVDNWVVKFEDKFVEQSDIDRGTSLALFRRIFGEYQTPSEGFAIDEVGSMPQAYSRGGQPSEFEQQIWQDFWTFANDQEKAKEKGIRAAHGEALSMKVEPGKSYRVSLRASDGLSITPETPSTQPQ